MDVQTVIDTAIAAGASTLGAPEAANVFRQSLMSAIRVDINLTPGQKAHLQKLVGYPLVFVGGKTVTNDHPLLVALRDIVRGNYEREFAVSRISQRGLVVGASMREIAMYQHNPFIHYFVYGKETKDYGRVVRPALQEISKNLKKKAAKVDKRVFQQPDDRIATRPVVKRYWDFEQIFADYMNLNKLPGTIHLDYIESDVLLFEDSFYNFSEEDWINVFERTGAQVAYRYGLLPLELLFSEMPENPIYSIHRHADGKISLTFRHGYCTGYVHDSKTWATLLKAPVISDKKKNIHLAVEICSRAGRAVTFKVMRVRNVETFVRTIELTPEQQYVKILDIKQCVNRRTGKVNEPLQYFSVFEEEFIDTYNYCLSLDEKSLTFPNVVSYVRRAN